MDMTKYERARANYRGVVECCRGEVWVRSLPIFYTAAPPFMVMPSYVNVCARYEHPCDVQGFRLPSALLMPSDAVGVRSR